MTPLRVINAVGARPNFMKVSPIHAAMQQDSRFDPVLVHTGQHYDPALSAVFFDELGLEPPGFHLGVGSGSHAEQTAAILVAFEKVCRDVRPDLLVVVGDVNSTLACTLVAAKLGVPTAHVESGLRSRDRRMPEEINRLVTDALADVHFIHSPEARDNLLREGVPPDHIHHVGNVMIDSLVQHLPRAEERYRSAQQTDHPPGSFGLVTLHRPSNVDGVSRLKQVLEALGEVARDLPLIFPAHPRTRKMLDDSGLAPAPGIEIGEPMGYLDFLGLMRHARLVITDSGGVQEETSYLDVPCVTVRENTERPITLDLGTNVLAGLDPQRVVECCRQQLAHPRRAATIPLWDGHSAERILDVLGRMVRDA